MLIQPHRVLLLAFALAPAACGSSDDFKSDPVDVSGSYSVSVTNKSNACALQNWTDGAQSNAIPVTMTQNGTSVTGTIDGLVGAYVKLVLGSNTFQGKVDGSTVNATNFGTSSYKQNNCTYTLNLEMNATLSGNSLQGTITYKPKTNASPDCGTLESCENIQEFAGSRPPK